MFAINEVVLADPQLGNRENLPLSVNVLKRRSGKHSSTTKKPLGKIYDYIFENVRYDTYQSLVETIKSANGGKVDIFDHEDRNFPAFILEFQGTNSSIHEDYTVTMKLRSADADS